MGLLGGPEQRLTSVAVPGRCDLPVPTPRPAVKASDHRGHVALHMTRLDLHGEVPLPACHRSSVLRVSGASTDSPTRLKR